MPRRRAAPPKPEAPEAPLVDAKTMQQFASPLVPIESAFPATSHAATKLAGLDTEMTAAPLNRAACRRLFTQKPNAAQQGQRPPKLSSLTEEQKRAFSMGGAVQLHERYMHSDFHNSASKHRSGFTSHQFMTPFLSNLIEKCTPLADKCKREDHFDPKRDPFACPAGYHQRATGHFVCRAAERYRPHIAGKRGFVIGSQWPWVESILFVAGVRELVTIEYANATTDYPNYSVIHPDELVRQFVAGSIPKFDFGFTFSSLEHDGLGRYGDPLNPTGDLESVAQAHCLLKPGGHFFFGVPTYHDKVYFNSHREYGRLRLPLVFAPFKLIDVIEGQVYINPSSPFPVIGKGKAQGPDMIFVLNKTTVARSHAPAAAPTMRLL